MDSHGRTVTGARIFNPESSAAVIIAVTPEAPAENINALEKVGAAVITVPAAHGRVCFQAFDGDIGCEREITSVLVEGGGEVNASAIAAGVVDKVMCFIAPKLIGGRNAPGPIGGEGISSLSDVPRLQRVSITPISDSADFLIEGYL